MKSKTSFINKTVMLKNIKIYWPIWMLYLAITLVIGPFRMWSQYRNGFLLYGNKWKNYELDYMSPAISMRSTVVLIFIFAIIIAIALFGYLYNSKSCNMIHAMPVTRVELFTTNVATGLAFLWVPQIIRYVVSLMICLSYGTSDVLYLGQWLLVSLGISAVAYSIACFCVMLTGISAAAAFLYALVNFLYIGIFLVISSVISYISYGITISGLMKDMKFLVLTPIVECIGSIGFESNMKETETMYYCDSYSFYGTAIVASCAVAAVFIYLISYFVYKKRDLENAGSLIAVTIVRPFFKGGVACFGGFAGGVAAVELLSSAGICARTTGVFFISLALGLILFLIVEMLFKKSFKVMRKKLLKEAAFFAGFVLLIYLGIAFTGNKIENNIPDASQVEKAYVYLDYTMPLEGDDIQTAIDFQKKILEQKENYQKYRYTDTINVDFRYDLKDGTTIERQYEFAYTKCDAASVCKNIYELECKPNNLVNAIASCDIADMTFVDGVFTIYDSSYMTIGAKQLSADDVKKIFDAVKADAKEGTLSKYVLSSSMWSGIADASDAEALSLQWQADLNINYLLEKGITVYSDGYSDIQDINTNKNNVITTILAFIGIYTESSIEISHTNAPSNIRGMSINFGSDCTNIINALIECGAIESADDICTRAMYEKYE